MRKLLVLIIIVFVWNGLSAQETNRNTELLIRCDDIGMCHSVNMAAKQLVETGLPFSASVMFACPWYQEAVDLLRGHPHISVGVHLTLNAEWKNYRWGPVAGAYAVPSLVDGCGYFLPSRAAFNANHPGLKEMETELRAQIERAVNSGLQIDYLDYHMGTAVDKPEYRAIVKKLADEYQLAISRYLGEYEMDKMYNDPIPSKTDSLLVYLEKINPEKVNLLVCHIGLHNPELAALEDLNTFGLKEMSQHRQAELNALIAPAFKAALQKKSIRLITYRDLIQRVGLENMQPPTVIEY